MVSQTRTRPVVSYVLYRTDSAAGGPMGLNRMHGKMPALTLPEKTQRFLKNEGGAGNHPTPNLQFEIGELTATLEDYSEEPEQFFTPTVHTFRSRIYLPPAASGGDANALKPVRIRGYFMTHRTGELQRQQVGAQEIVILPIELWVKSVNVAQTADFANAAVGADDVLRLNSEEWIWWAGGVDQLAAYRTLMGVSI